MNINQEFKMYMHKTGSKTARLIAEIILILWGLSP